MTPEAPATSNAATAATPRRRRIALMVEGKFDILAGKTATGVLRYSPHDVVAVLDSVNAGRTVHDVLGFGGAIPVVADIAAALAFSPDTALVGIAPTGGKLPKPWRVSIRQAIEAGLDVWSGMHMFLSDDPEFAAAAADRGVALWDVRRPRPDLVVADGSALKSKAFVVLTVGTDCNVGKMTTAYELARHAKTLGYKAGFVATGQTGILIEGRGTPLDAVPGDFMSGEVERLTMELDAEGMDVIFVEGQGAVVHPGFGAVTLALMLGAMPDAYVLVHQPGRKTFRPDYDVALPSLTQTVAQYEGLMEYHKAPKVLCTALNTYGMDEADATAAAESAESELGVPARDPIREGVADLFDALLPAMKAKLGR